MVFRYLVNASLEDAAMPSMMGGGLIDLASLPMPPEGGPFSMIRYALDLPFVSGIQTSDSALMVHIPSLRR